MYFPVKAEEAPVVTSADGLVTVNVFAGEVLGAKGPVPSQVEVNAATLVLKKDGTISIPVPENHNTVLYLLDGKLNVDGFGMVEALHLVHFKKRWRRHCTYRIGRYPSFISKRQTTQ